MSNLHGQHKSDNLNYGLFVVADQLQSNFETLIEMDPKHIDDILPLISVQKAQLDQFKQVLKEQTPNRSNENPIYYFSKKLKVSMAKLKNFDWNQQEVQTNYFYFQ